jgi:hypothetical protein
VHNFMNVSLGQFSVGYINNEITRLVQLSTAYDGGGREEARPALTSHYASSTAACCPSPHFRECCCLATILLCAMFFVTIPTAIRISRFSPPVAVDVRFRSSTSWMHTWDVACFCQHVSNV